jgi:CheY-like chemotaxis protein
LARADNIAHPDRDESAHHGAMRKVPRAAPRETFEGSERRERLLYVEDNDDNWEVAQLRLCEVYELVRASRSHEACALIRDGGQFDLILMDIELRGSELTGVELTRLLRGDSLGIAVPPYAADLPKFGKPIVFVTAHGAKFSDAQLLDVGGTRVISKPVDFGELRRAVAELTRSDTFHPPRS